MIVLSIVLFITLVNYAEGADKPRLRCYVCDSSEYEYCDDTFRETGNPVKPCAGGCVKTKLGDNQVFRYCVAGEVKEGCITHSSPRSVECYCKRDLCNSAIRVAWQLDRSSIAAFTMLSLVIPFIDSHRATDTA